MNFTSFVFLLSRFPSLHHLQSIIQNQLFYIFCSVLLLFMVGGKCNIPYPVMATLKVTVQILLLAYFIVEGPEAQSSQAPPCSRSHQNRPSQGGEAAQSPCLSGSRAGLSKSLPLFASHFLFSSHSPLKRLYSTAFSCLLSYLQFYHISHCLSFSWL